MTDLHPELAATRADWPVLARSTYLASHTLGAMHRGTADGLARYAALWAEHGINAWEQWTPELRRVADLVGATIGAPPGTTVLKGSTADALGALVSCLDLGGRRNRIVFADEVEWPGSNYLLREQTRLGADVVTVPISTDGGIHVDEQRLVEAIDGRTALVYLSAVLFRTSTVLDVAPVVERAHRAGALVVLDAYQAAGTLPLDVVALDVDACVGGSVKYLCGGPGAGWMYVAPRLVESLRPAQTSWFGHAHPFDFAFAEMDYAPGVDRFTGGTPGVPAAYAAAPGYEAVLAAGVTRIRERSLSLTRPLIDGALDRGWRVSTPTDDDRRGGHVAIDPGEPAKALDALRARGFILDHRPGVGLRIGPHFYTTADEVAAVLEVLDDVSRPPVAVL